MDERYSGRYGAPRSAYINGGYFTRFGYQPYSMTITPSYGGAIYQGNGGMIGPGFYSPYSYGGYLPGISSMRNHALSGLAHFPALETQSCAALHTGLSNHAPSGATFPG